VADGQPSGSILPTVSCLAFGWIGVPFADRPYC